MSNKHVTWWLERELPVLMQEGVVDGATAERIRNHYRANEGAGRNWALVVFGVLGGGLIGLGIILLLAHNWADMPRALRTVLSLLPLAAAQLLGGRILRREITSPVWREGVGMFWTLAIGASIALVAQTYHIPGDAGRFALTWMLLTLPVIYLLNATGPVLIYLAGMTFWLADTKFSGGLHLLYWPLVALAAPHIVAALREGSPYRMRPSLLLWAVTIAFCHAVPITLEKVLSDLFIPVFASVAGLLYLAGKRWFGEGASAWQRPFQTIGALGLLVMSFVLTYEDPWSEWRRDFSLDWSAAGLVDIALALVLMAGFGLLLARTWREPGRPGWYPGLMPALALGGCVFVYHGGPVSLAMLAFNLYLFVLGLQKLRGGFRDQQLATMNHGLSILFLLIMLRFFDAGLGFVARGIVFVLLGSAFLITNLVLARRRKEVAP